MNPHLWTAGARLRPGFAHCRFYLAWLVVPFLPATPATAELKKDETVVLYPAPAWPTRDGWRVSLKGIVYEAGEHPRQAAVFRKLLGLDNDELTDDERRVFRSRVEAFLVDNERGKRLQIQIGSQTVQAGRSGANGHFETEFVLDAQVGATGAAATGAVLRLTARFSSASGPPREVPFEIHLIGARGWSVISDIDDTIKISNVRDKRALIRSTFCAPFQAVPGMAAAYRGWAGEGAGFHYVSASPWQLYAALNEFVVSNGFPSGPFHMKSFRMKDASALQMAGPQNRYKSKAIEAILRRFPDRIFVLVGDSGEQDPEIYGEIARRHAGQIRHTYIRDVTGEGPGSVRYRRAFRGLSPGAWTIFTDPLVLVNLPAASGVAR